MKIGRWSQRAGGEKSNLKRPKTLFVFISAPTVRSEIFHFVQLLYQSQLFNFAVAADVFFYPSWPRSRSHKKRVNFINWNANMCSWMYARIKQSIVSTALWYHTIWTSFRAQDENKVEWSLTCVLKLFSSTSNWGLTRKKKSNQKLRYELNEKQFGGERFS